MMKVLVVMVIAIVLQLAKADKISAKIQSKVNAEEDLPAGGYQDNCKNCEIAGNGLLECDCLRVNGNYKETHLQNAWACDSCIRNVDGTLTCEFPEGKYVDTCFQCGENFGTLDCFCENEDGDLVGSTLKESCACENVENVDGELTCTTGTAAPTPSTASPTTCDWSSDTENGEKTPEDLCSDKSGVQGCKYNNFCCWNYNNDVCQPPKVDDDRCQECPGLSKSDCNDDTDCCNWNGDEDRCERKCLGEVSEVCPTS